jgi:hypothetical protein
VAEYDVAVKSWSLRKFVLLVSHHGDSSRAEEGAQAVNEGTDECCHSHEDVQKLLSLWNAVNGHEWFKVPLGPKFKRAMGKHAPLCSISHPHYEVPYQSAERTF